MEIAWTEAALADMAALDKRVARRVTKDFRLLGFVCRGKSVREKRLAGSIQRQREAEILLSSVCRFGEAEET